MICWDIGVITKIIKTSRSCQEVEVLIKDDIAARAIHYLDTLSPLQVGDTVLLNTTAKQLGLGSGGVHFVHAVLSNDASMSNVTEAYSEESLQNLATSKKQKGHLMKLKYTSLQRKVLAAEEKESGFSSVFHKDNHLQKTPVLIGELHSMLPIAALWLNHAFTSKGDVRRRNHSDNLRFVYIMSDGGALPLAWSQHVPILQQMGLLAGTVTYGQAYGGDLETLNKFTALLAARHILKADIIMVAMGPGIAGTGTDLGHTAMETGELINAVSILNGTPIYIPRISFADSRSRHYGVSHHTITALSLTALRPALLPLPFQFCSDQQKLIREQLHVEDIVSRHQIRYIESISIQKVIDLCYSYPIPLTTMGREVQDDLSFFLSVCAAAQVAVDCLHELAKNAKLNK